MIIASIVGIIVLCCCGLLAVATIYGNSPEAQAASTARALAQETTPLEQTTVTTTLEITEAVNHTNTPIPTDLPHPTDTPILTSTPISTNTPTITPSATKTPLPTNTPTIPSTEVSLESGGLGLFTAEWEQNHERTELDWGIGTGYDNVYDVLFLEDKVWIIYRNFDIPATLDEIDLASTQLIPFDSEYIETYTPEGRPETTVIVYKSNFLTTRFDSDFWSFAEPGVFIVQYKTYEDFGIGDMIISIDNNP
jgi:hypothetical protein